MIAEAVRRAYDGRARYYNGLVRMLSFGGDSGYRRKAVAELRLRPGDRVLDVGCGTGLNFRYLAREVGPSGLVAGTDPSRGMMREAPRGARLVQAAAGHEVFKPGTFDAVLCTYVISTMIGENVLAPILRVLKPGGRLVVVDDSLPPGWYVGPLFMLRNLLRHGWPDLRRETVRALEPHLREMKVSFCHYGMIYVISGVRR